MPGGAADVQSKRFLMNRTKFEPVRFENGCPMLIAGLRRHHGYTESERGLGEQWGQFMASAPALPGQVGTTIYGIMCGANASGFEYMCGVEVDSFAAVPPTSGRIRILPQRYAVFVHSEHISRIRSTWERIWRWLEDGPCRSAHKPDFEIYDHRFNADTGFGDVEIWVAVESKR
jgi:predicted transcriptional regulator YdeE